MDYTLTVIRITIVAKIKIILIMLIIKIFLTVIFGGNNNIDDTAYINEHYNENDEKKGSNVETRMKGRHKYM